MDNETKKALIIIPIYRPLFDDFEMKSLESVNRYLGDYPIVFIAPHSLNTDFLRKDSINFNYDIVRFDNHFFSSIEGYNQLLLSSHFYKSFLDYEFMLICQTDAYIFKNELDYWVQQNYDYIGAPWLDSKNVFFNHQLRTVFNKLKKIMGLKEKLYTHINQVGNGGFSLRKTTKFYEITLQETETIQRLLTHREKENYHIEDVFWSLYIPHKYAFSKPDFKTAVRFCVDRKPETAFSYLNNQLPFACHGFNKKGVAKFWSKYL